MNEETMNKIFTPAVISIGALSFFAGCFDAISATVSRAYTNTTALTIPESIGPTTPVYPSVISVADQPGIIQKVTVQVRGLSHFSVSDVGVMLQSPAGAEVLLFSAAGGISSVSDLIMTIDDDAALSMPNGQGLVSGTYKPSNYFDGEWIFSNEVQQAYSTTLATFNGSTPNGDWKLFVYDASEGAGGSLSNGWVLAVTTVSSNEPPVFSPATNQITTEGGTLVFSVSASDPADNDTITLSNEDRPAGASFADNGNGTGSFSWTNASPVGVYTTTFVAADKDGSVTQSVMITVQAASDGDSIDDIWELQNFGNLTTANNTTDFDGDRFIDLHEFLAGTVPTNASSFLQLTALSSEGAHTLIRWAGVTGKTYSVGLRTNLLSGGFSTIVSNITGVAPVTTVTASPPASASPALFRIQLEAPAIP